jgi:hypothetical protein
MNPQEYHKWLGDVSKMADDVKKAGGEICETHNRFALLYLERMKIPSASESRESLMCNGFNYEYNQCKLVVGTVMLGIIHNPDFTNHQHLYHIKREANQKGWLLRHYDPISVDVGNISDVIEAAFGVVLGMAPRPCDVRICTQMGSPDLWKTAAPSDFIIDGDQEKESERLLSFGDTIKISRIAFAQEAKRYIVEHMKRPIDGADAVAFVKNVEMLLHERR